MAFSKESFAKSRHIPIKKVFLVLFVIVLTFTSISVLFAQDASKITFGGQARIREELNGAAQSKNSNFFYTTYRFRFNVTAELNDNTTVFFQPQKVGVFGNNETGATLDSSYVTVSTTTGIGSTNVGVHQAYLELKKIFGEKSTLKIGRQEIVVGDHRLLGNVDWTNKARSLDGINTSFDFKSGKLTLLTLKLAGDSESGNEPSGDFDGDYNLYVLHWGNTVKDLSYEVLFANDIDNRTTPTINRKTYGLYLVKKPKEGLNFRGEIYFQTGKNKATGNDISAKMYALHLGYAVATYGLTLGYENLSGDEDTTDTKDKSFNTLLATNHKYYGYMDYFLTNNTQGLKDLFLKLNFNLDEKRNLALDYHNFSLNSILATTGKKNLGSEIDFTYSCKKSKNTNFILGISRYLATNTMKTLKGLANATNNWGYLQIDVKY